VERWSAARRAAGSSPTRENAGMATLLMAVARIDVAHAATLKART
jgi:hypothetical protein